MEEIYERLPKSQSKLYINAIKKLDYWLVQKNRRDLLRINPLVFADFYDIRWDIALSIFDEGRKLGLFDRIYQAVSVSGEIVAEGHDISKWKKNNYVPSLMTGEDVYINLKLVEVTYRLIKTPIKKIDENLVNSIKKENVMPSIPGASIQTIENADSKNIKNIRESINKMFN